MAEQGLHCPPGRMKEASGWQHHQSSFRQACSWLHPLAVERELGRQSFKGSCYSGSGAVRSGHTPSLRRRPGSFPLRRPLREQLLFPTTLADHVLSC